MTEAVIHPASLSADSKRNAFYTQCNVIGESKPYAMCLYLIERKNDSSLQTLYRECTGAIKCGKCPAIAMKDEEQLKGQAIYFIERARGAAVVAQQAAWVPAKPYRRGKYESGATIDPTPRAPSPYVQRAAPTPQREPAKPKAPVFDGNIYGVSLSIAHARQGQVATNRQSPPAIPTPAAAAAPVSETPVTNAVAPPTPIIARVGESPLEMARRLRAATQFSYPRE
jgi:hypothetical protein